MRQSLFLRMLAGFLVSLMTLGMIGGVAVFGVIQHYGHDLPSFEKLQDYQPATSTRLYAGNGRLLVEYATEKRVFVPLSAMPKQLVNAFLSAEDKNFYQHPGIDFMGIARAMGTNVLNIGKNRSLVGGSTITQQVVKNFLLTREQSVERKVKEAILSFRISKVLSKDKVLELYLNQIYLGYGSYGVAAAALQYFNKSLDELTLEESAFLAALPKAPGKYNPRNSPEQTKERRDWVIDRMAEDGVIAAEEAKMAKLKPIEIRSRDETEFANAAFFAEEVRRTLADWYGADALYQGGLTVHTTVDPILQKYARDALREALIAYDRRHGYHGPLTTIKLVNWAQELEQWKRVHPLALVGTEQAAVVLQVNDADAKIGLLTGQEGKIPLEQMLWARTVLKKPADILNVGDVVVVGPLEGKKDVYELRQIPEVNGAMMAMDPHTGRVLAMVGGYSYENTEFNRATQAKRQPGSSFKPFVYMTALENGFTPSTIVMDAPIELSQGAGLPMWRPKNYKGDYLGPTTLRVGLETSRNVMTVRLALALGIEKILQTAYRFGVYDKLDPNYSIVLGSTETTLDRLVNAYAMIVNGGKRVRPALIERIQDRNGKTIYRRDARECPGCVETKDHPLVGDLPPIPEDTREQVLDPRVAYQMVSIMEGVVQRGTATGAKKLNRPVAGKTGTTNDSRDAWFIGYTPDLVAGVYIGFDTPRKLGKMETGGKAALPAFVSFMQNALKDEPPVPFRIPDGIKLMKVDLKTGWPPSATTLPKNIIFEAFKEEDIPGSMPVVDIANPNAQQQPVAGEGVMPYQGGEETSPAVGTGGLY